MLEPVCHRGEQRAEDLRFRLSELFPKLFFCAPLFLLNRVERHENCPVGQVAAVNHVADAVEHNWRQASKSTSSSSVYSCRTANPPPVASRQSVSESQSGNPNTLSNACRWPFVAAMKMSRSSRGSDRSGDMFGSIRLRRIATSVDFAVPCSPLTASSG